MGKFAKRLMVFFIVFFVADKAFIPLRNYSAGTEADKRLEWVLEGQMNKDLIIIGSSRGARNVIAKQLEQELGVTAYNLSYPGSNVEFHEFVLRKLIEHNRPPKTLVLVIDDKFELLPSPNIHFRYDRLYPLVKYREIRDELVNRDQKIPVLNELFVLYQLSKSSFDIRQKQFSSLEVLTSHGSMPIDEQEQGLKWKFGDDQTYDSEQELESKRRSFIEIQRLCQDNKIQLVYAFPPNFKTMNHAFYNRITQLAEGTASIMVYDTSNDHYSNKDYYFDSGHLRRNGAKLFTAELVHFLRDRRISLNQ